MECMSLSYNHYSKALFNSVTVSRFLLAQLHMDSLAREDNRKAIRKALKNLPKELNETYDNAMQRIQSQSYQQVRRAEQVLSWISYAVRPLTIKEIQCALAVEPEDTEMDEEALPEEDPLVSVCAGLVTIDRESNVIRLVHYTTQEYFQQTRMRLFPEAQTEIARTCLTYLLFDTFSEGACSSGKDMEARLQENPLLQYAALHWGVHAHGVPEQKISELAVKFLEENSKLSCAVQAMHIPSYQYIGYSQSFPRNVTGLHVAASFGLENIITMLLEKGADATAQDRSGRTALHWAAGSGHEAVVRLLLEKEADAAAQNNNGWTALHWAAWGGHKAVARLLLDKEADAAAQDQYGETALHKAARGGHEAVVRLLLDKGANAAAQNQYGETALHKAAWGGHEAVVRLLLDKGANAAAQNNNGWTALHKAAWGGHEAVVRLLLDKGADAAAQDKKGETALHKAARHEAVVQLLTLHS
jgi:ankyrin repeat protein